MLKNKNFKNLSYFKFALYIIEIIPKHIKSIQLVKNQIIIRISPSSILFVFNFLKNHWNTKFKILSTITAVDFPEEKKRFQINYILLSLNLNYRICIVCETDELTPVESITNIYQSANWFEREVWDMFGIFFSNHMDLRRILTDYGFDGFPMRKDFPQTGYVEVRYDDEKKYVIYEPLEITQEYRTFDFDSSWLQVK